MRSVSSLKLVSLALLGIKAAQGFGDGQMGRYVAVSFVVSVMSSEVCTYVSASSCSTGTHSRLVISTSAASSYSL